jgi:hypothetical protein
MNKQNLMQDLESAAYSRLSVVDEVAFLGNVATGLASRDRALFEGFSGILAVTGSSRMQNGDTTPDIIVGSHEQKTLGLGQLAVRIAMDGIVEGLGYIVTDAEFQRAGHRPIHLDQEYYSAIPQPGDGDYVGWAQLTVIIRDRKPLELDRSWLDRSCDLLESLTSKWNGDIANTEATLQMVREAVQDPALNPQFAERAAALQQA